MRLPPSDPKGDQDNEDPFAEFPSEPEGVPEISKDQDWLAEFPDEKSTPVARSKTWGQLSRNLTNEPEGK